LPVSNIGSSAREREILALERRLYDAMIRQDHGELNSLIAQDATYVHSNGVEETREKYLLALQEGTYEYDKIEAEDVKLCVAGEAVFITGRVMMSVGRRGDAKLTVPLLSTLIWVMEDGHWRLWRRHATRLPAAQE
jgi:hypothetical protein